MVQKKKKKTFKVQAVKENVVVAVTWFPRVHHHSRLWLLGVLVLGRSGQRLLFPTCRCRFLLGLVNLPCCTFSVCICLVSREERTLAATKVLEGPRPAVMLVDAHFGLVR